MPGEEVSLPITIIHKFFQVEQGSLQFREYSESAAYESQPNPHIGNEHLETVPLEVVRVQSGGTEPLQCMLGDL